MGPDGTRRHHGGLLAAGRRSSRALPRPAGRRPRPRRALVAFLTVPLLVLVAVAGATLLLSERIARANALAAVENSTVRMSRYLIEPLLQDALAGVPGRWEELDRVIANRLRDGSIDSVVIWTASGEVLWASDDRLIGQRIDRSPELDAALAGRVVSDLDTAPETEHAGERPSPKLEVYVPATIRGERFVVEAYYEATGVEQQAALLRDEITPLAVGALVVLQLVQIPIALSLAGRLRRQEAERAALMQRNLDASDHERRTIAADVHDGPVQDLAGVAYALTGLRDSVPPERAPTMDRAIEAVRHAVHSLRRLMIDIFPPDLSGPGLAVALGDLAQPLRDQGVTVDIDTGPLPGIGPGAAAVVYRSAKEALSNVAHHAQATRVWITLCQADDAAVPCVRLEIADDGVGFADPATADSPEGHLGLRLLRDRVADIGGCVTLDNRPDGGAVVALLVPAEHGR